ncbi:MAG: hypothetical protein MI975_10785 [Cytophagales bacterium]|nr:hypothetical protein [Cytophagales bacterium]
MKKKTKLEINFYVAIVIDIIMMILLTVNLSLIVFDWIFAVAFVNGFLEKYTPDFYDYYYHQIHLNFTAIDLLFVAAFLSEFLLSWVLAIVRNVYHKWFFYPFIHWYDILGCIPVGSLRFLRILRVFSILIRLQNLKIIDLSKTYLFAKLTKYYGIIVEEISDRVVVNIIEGVQEEIDEGGPVVDAIINKVIRPKQDILVEWVSRRLEYALERDVLIKKQELDLYVKDLISESLSKNAELKTIEQVPVMGRIIMETIENAITNVINNVLDKIITDLASYKNRELVNDATNVILNSIEYEDEESALKDVFKEISIDALEIIKEQVKVQKWKIKEETESETTETEQKNIELLMMDKP